MAEHTADTLTVALTLLGFAYVEANAYVGGMYVNQEARMSVIPPRPELNRPSWVVIGGPTNSRKLRTPTQVLQRVNELLTNNTSGDK